jgi:phosphoserine aminotransferase
MNLTFNLKTVELEKKFLEEAKSEGFVGVNGHRSIGGCRVSAYNAVPVEACQAFSEFMIKFQKENN